VSGYAGAPITQSASYGARAAVGASASLVLAFRRWDIIASGSLGDLTRDVSTFLALGVAKRWGL